MKPGRNQVHQHVPSNAPIAAGLTTEEKQMLQFARIWAPYGGPSSEDLYVAFGLSRIQFNERIASALARSGTSSPPSPATDRPAKPETVRTRRQSATE